MGEYNLTRDGIFFYNLLTCANLSLE